MHFKNVENSCNQKKKKNMCVLNVFLNVFLNAFINVFLNIFLNVLNSTSQANLVQPHARLSEKISTIGYVGLLLYFYFERLASKLKTKGHHILLKAPKNCEIHTIG